jgi:hypothetical protein
VQATVHQRTWDIANWLLNEADTSATWTYDGTNVTSYSQTDFESHHVETGFGGWNLDAHSTCCGTPAGVPALTVYSYFAFKYQGRFDPTGTLFYNTYNNELQLLGNGQVTCRIAYTWRNSLVWHKQDWCAYGGF